MFGMSSRIVSHERLFSVSLFRGPVVTTLLLLSSLTITAMRRMTSKSVRRYSKPIGAVILERANNYKSLSSASKRDFCSRFTLISLYKWDLFTPSQLPILFPWIF